MMMDLRVKLVSVALGGWLLLAASPAAAISYDYDFTAADHNTSDIALVGSAAWVTDGSLSPANRLRLTSNGGGQVGNAWINTGSVIASQAWTANFTWQISFGNGGGADGLGFHLQEDGLSANTFFNGAGLSNPRFSVGIDTFDNSEGSNFHVEVHLDGSQIYADNLSVIPGMGNSFDDIYQVFMAYDGANNFALNVVNTNGGANTGIANIVADLSSLDGATVGFSANTGGFGENHDIRTFNGEFSAVPEPGTGLLLSIGLVGLAVRRNRQA